MMVVDASISLAWCFRDESTAFTDSINARIHRGGAYAPGLWIAEIANAFVVAERRGRSTVAETAEHLALIESMPIRIDDEASRDHARYIVEIAQMYGLSAYDAAYLEYAQRIRQPLVTLDQRLQAAARLFGVALILS